MSPAVAAEWERCREWIIPALEDTTEAALLEELASGEAQIWGGQRSAAVTQLLLLDEPVVMIWIAGGDMQELMAMQPGLEAWGRANGAVALRVSGRKGWNRALRGAGFERVGEVLRRKI